MSTVLVTGGAGFIGSHIAERLAVLGHRVRILDNFSSGRRGNLAGLEGHLEVIESDVRDAEACDRACAGVEFVFHQAAIPSVPRSIEQPEASHEVNGNGTFNVLSAARRRGVRRVMYAGSSSVYGNSPESPKHEGLRPDPLSPYAAQKLMGEYYCRVFHECFGMETVSLRYFNVFGSRQDPGSDYAAAIPAFVTAVLRGQPPTVYGDGEQTRDFTHVDNVVQANLRAMEAAATHGECVNVACGESISLNDVIREIGSQLGRGVKPNYAPRRPGDVLHSRAAIGRAAHLLGYAPSVGFREGLARAIEYYRSVAR